MRPQKELEESRREYENFRKITLKNLDNQKGTNANMPVIPQADPGPASEYDKKLEEALVKLWNGPFLSSW